MDDQGSIGGSATAEESDVTTARPSPNESGSVDRSTRLDTGTAAASSGPFTRWRLWVSRSLPAVHRVSSIRVVRFAMVGGICAAFQFAVNLLFRVAEIPAVAGFALSFVVSAQLNFLLSDRFTWGGRRDGAGVRWRIGTRWLTYNLSTVAALVVSSTAFALASLVVDNAVAVLFGIAAGSVLTFFVGDRVIFASRADRVAMKTDLGEVDESRRPRHAAQFRDPGIRNRSFALYTIPEDRLSAMLGTGIAVFLPSYNESANLPSVVRNTLTALRDVPAPFQVIIVNDGSQDDTPAVAAELAETYHPYVSTVSHPVNLGYGNALRSGFAAGLAGGWDWVGFTDSDNQFNPEQMKDLIAVAFHEHVDLVAGYRIKRADGFARRLNGRLWHLLSRGVVGLREHDVDCGFKLVHRNVLERIDLQGTYAAVSPELLAKTRRAGFRSAEVGVNHYPRTQGEQTGANLTVVIRSLISLLTLRMSMSHAGRTDEAAVVTAPRIRPPAGSRLMALIASALSIAAFLFFYVQGDTLLYDDSISHLLIARRVLEGVTPGAAQLGSVWLPLPHLLVQPLIGFDFLYYNGIAGSLLSMASFVVCAVMLFKIASVMTGGAIGGWAAGLIFSLNPNMLFLQSTPMTETLLFACMAAAVYQLLLWSQSDRWQNLAGAAAAIFLASLTRYEGWVLLGAAGVTVFYVTARRSYQRDRLVASLVFFGVLAASGVAAWLIWNRVIFGSFTDFATGQFAKPSLWVNTADKAVGDLPISIRTYASAVSGTVGLPLTVLAVGGVIRYVWRGRLRPGWTAPLTLLIYLAFFVVALYDGQRPLHVLEISGDLYNTRFGLVMLLAASLFSAYLLVEVGRWLGGATRLSTRTAAVSAWHRVLAVTALVSGILMMVAGGAMISGGVLTLDEPLNWSGSKTQLKEAAAALHDDYDGGRVLMQGFGNEYVTFASQVPTNQTIYEGSYKLWGPALVDPFGQNIKWIYLARIPSDLVWQALGKSAELSDYVVRFDDGTRVLYERRSPPQPSPEAPA